MKEIIEIYEGLNFEDVETSAGVFEVNATVASATIEDFGKGDLISIYGYDLEDIEVYSEEESGFVFPGEEEAFEIESVISGDEIFNEIVEKAIRKEYYGKEKL